MNSNQLLNGGGQQPQNNQPSGQTLALARHNVKDLLLKSDSFRALPPEKQKEIAKNTVQIASYLAEPEGIKGNKLDSSTQLGGASDPYTVGLADSTPPEFKAQAGREGAAVAGVLLEEVNFPTFVGGLITNVFDAIVDSSIEQMEAYGKLVSSVAMTLNEFRDQNVSANQGRDHLVEQFPDLFKIDIDTGDFGDEKGGPRVRLREDADEMEALKRVNKLPLEGGSIESLDDSSIEGKLVPAARTQLATSRQQLLATMVLMGINRIVVTHGKISAKVNYTFSARDNLKYQSSATRFDAKHEKDRLGNVQTAYSQEGEYDEKEVGGSSRFTNTDEEFSHSQRDASSYAKGTYKFRNTPIIKMSKVEASQTANDAQLTTQASLAGSVEVNFKSDYLPLEKMADSFQIAMIQNAAGPGQQTGARGSAAPPPAAKPPSQTS